MEISSFSFLYIRDTTVGRRNNAVAFGMIVREQDICDKEIKNKNELCYNASDQTNKITGDPSYETYYNRRTETS